LLRALNEAVTSPWARLYFVAWWVLIVLIIINVFVAITLEAVTVARVRFLTTPAEDEGKDPKDAGVRLQHRKKLGIHDLVE
jgi:uncharacterized membrane protein